MKKRLTILLIALALLIGCTKEAPVDEHPEWNEYPVRFGNVLAAETIDGFTLNETNDVMSIAGLWYATWTAGEGTEIKNAQGKDAAVFDAQIYLLLKEGQTEKGTEADVKDWIKRETDAYETTETTVTVNGRQYRVLHLLSSGDGNPYHHGEAAFLQFGANAVTVEVLAKEDFSGNTEDVLMQFLSKLHY